MQIRGNFYAEVFEYIEIRLVLCPVYGGSECATPEQAEAFFNDDFRVNVAFSNNLVNFKGD